MDGRRFDALTRVVWQVRSRRQVLRWPLAAGLGGLLVAASPNGAAAACIEDGERCGGDRGPAVPAGASGAMARSAARLPPIRASAPPTSTAAWPGAIRRSSKPARRARTPTSVSAPSPSRAVVAAPTGGVECVDCDNDADCVDHATANNRPRAETWHCLSCPDCGGFTTACAASCENPAPLV
jgi:hypothetical protein